MLRCVDRIRDTSGNIKQYVFDDGSIVTDSKVRATLKKNSNCISNLKLSSDNKILYTEETQNSNINIIDNIVNLIDKTHKLTLSEYRQVLKYIVEYTSLDCRLLNKNSSDETCVELYQLVPYTIQANYIWYNNWSIIIFDGNYVLDDCLYMELKVNRDYTKADIKSSLNKLKSNSIKLFNSYETEYELIHFLKSNYNKMFRHKLTYSMFGKILICQLDIVIAKAGVSLVELFITNQSSLSKSHNYMIQLKILGEPVSLSTAQLKRYKGNKDLQLKLLETIQVTIIDKVYETIKNDEYYIKRLLYATRKDNKLLIDMLGYEGEDLYDY